LTLGVIWELFKENVFRQLDAECLWPVPAQKIPATLAFKSVRFGSSELMLRYFIFPATYAFSIGGQL